MSHHNDTITALATPTGVSALAVVRLSGPDAISIVSGMFRGKELGGEAGNTIHYGKLYEKDSVLDEVLVSLFRAPHSYTGEDSIEISCHGSPLIATGIIKALIRRGARPAQAGEFTRRAFLNGKLDLTQAEGVADLIHAENESARLTALNQIKGGFSKELAVLREQLISFVSLIELELDFSEEDVEFARRDVLKDMLRALLQKIEPLIDSFDRGNVIRNGVRTVIAGRPNAGKSTLLNALLNEERAIVSEIPGTTRDVIEDVVHMGGLTLRFMDTAGLRETDDPIEAIGVSRTKEQMKLASLILYLVDASNLDLQVVENEIKEAKAYKIPVLLIGSKADQAKVENLAWLESKGFVCISAKSGLNIELLKNRVVELFGDMTIRPGETVVTNARHYAGLRSTRDALQRAIEGLETKVSGDLLAQDLREALHHLGELTGTISSDDLLEQIFSRFCIGK
ncbi:MAG: tRNA uridine-5-carboxymethylaminomethyl(34) synthesis GTPase MnmE [Bacteroidetes bacterium]|nr:tRNA uridine-5-carboxymethylaminomethyl(34) synthesis GTPase MnmE [Bacteroidota bacterium]